MTHRSAAGPGLPGVLGPALAWVRRLQGSLLGAYARAVQRAGAKADRGDVPGWVLITLMTAGLVLVLWGVAKERLTAVFNDAINGVIGGP